MRKYNLKRLVFLALLSSILAISTLITIPSWFLVPFTLQTLMIVVIGLLVLPAEAFLVVGVYLATGAIGLPIFSNFQGGIGHLISPTGGFLLAFPFAALLISLLKKDNKHIYNIVIINIIMLIFVYIIGIAQFIFVSNNSFSSTIILFLPFLLIDFIKNLIAYYLYLKINPLILKQFY